MKEGKIMKHVVEEGYKFRWTLVLNEIINAEMKLLLRKKMLGGYWKSSTQKLFMGAWYKWQVYGQLW